MKTSEACFHTPTPHFFEKLYIEVENADRHHP